MTTGKTIAFTAAAAKSLQSYPTLCHPIAGSPPGSPVPGILQATTLEWVAISFFNAWKWKVKVKSLSRVWLLATPWTTAYQAPPPMGFSRQEHWSGLPCLPPADLPYPHSCLLLGKQTLYHWTTREAPNTLSTALKSIKPLTSIQDIIPRLQSFLKTFLLLLLRLLSRNPFWMTVWKNVKLW